MKVLVKIVLFLILSLPMAVSAQDIPAKPEPPRLVNDLAGVLSATEKQALEKKLVAYDDSTSNQVVIVLIKTLNDFPIEEYSLKLFREWGIGNKKTNNGVLIVAAIDDRKIRIEPGYGLEGAIPDITANQIIVNDIVPAFRSADYYDGLNKATSSIIAAAAGEYKPPKDYHKKNKDMPVPMGLIIALVVLFIIISRNRGGGSGGFLSRRGFGPIIFPGGFGGGPSWGGGGWSGGGGGFGGFGGGSSGGGGASGSW